MRKCVGSCCDASKRLECTLDIAELRVYDEPSTERLSRGLPQQLRRQSALRAIIETTPRAGSGHRAEPSAIVGSNIRVVQHDVGRHAEASTAPRLGKREMNLRRQYIGQIVERERRLV